MAFFLRLCSFWAVYDGHGGEAISDFLVRELHVQVQHHLCGNGSSSMTNDSIPPGEAGSLLHVPQALVSAFAVVDKQVQQRDTGASGQAAAAGPPSDTAARAQARAAAAAAAWDCGSTAVVAVADWSRQQLWVASLGNSRALACIAPAVAAGAGISKAAWEARVLSHEHHPGMPLERQRIEAAGGYISGLPGEARRWEYERPTRPCNATQHASGGASSGQVNTNRHRHWRRAHQVLMHDGLPDTIHHALNDPCLFVCAGHQPRLMGDLEVSRAFGDLQYRPVGLSAIPDVSGPWHLGLQPGEAPAPRSSKSSSGGSSNTSPGAADGKMHGASTSAATAGGPSLAAEHAQVQQLALPLLVVLASDGVFERMSAQEACEHAAAQLAGSPTPPLSSLPAPAIAVGPAAPLQPDSREAQQHHKPAGTARVNDGCGDDGLGTPGCCDCSLWAASAAAQSGRDPCTDAGLVLTRSNARQQQWRSVEGAAMRLVQEAVNRGSSDNVATVVVQLTERGSGPLGQQAHGATSVGQPAGSGDKSSSAGTQHQPVGMRGVGKTSSSAAAADGDHPGVALPPPGQIPLVPGSVGGGGGSSSSSSAATLSNAQQVGTTLPVDWPAAAAGLLPLAAGTVGPGGVIVVPAAGNTCKAATGAGAATSTAGRLAAEAAAGAATSGAMGTCSVPPGSNDAQGSRVSGAAGSSRKIPAAAVDGNSLSTGTCSSANPPTGSRLYKLTERISAVPSLPYHLHRQSHTSGLPLHPLRLEQFAG